MHEAARLAAEGAPAGTAVVADEQTAGIGRHGHAWHSERRAGLYLSVILRPALEPSSLPLLTLALGLAMADAIRIAAGLACDLRWPNDVLSRGRKLAGILVQMHNSAAIAGIGINVNHESFPKHLAEEATSLRMETGCEHSRETLLEAVLLAVDGSSRMLVEDGPQAIVDLFSIRSSYVRGRRVRVAHQDDGDLVGVTAGLDSRGFLIVRKDDGSESLVLAGGVRPA